MKIFFVLSLTFFSLSTFGQVSTNENFFFWSSTHKLSIEDFVIKTKNLETTPSFAQFSVDYKVGGFDFLAKNFNKKVRSYMIKSASWIDTTYNIEASLKYQQTLFDMCEIYTRKFRKDLKENKKKIAGGTQFIEELNSKIMTDFSNRRVEYDRETKFGSDTVKQAEWEIQIIKELEGLKEFAFE